MSKIFRYIPLIIWLAFIAVLSLIPGDDIPHRGLFGIPHLDKVVHMGMYCILAFLLAHTYQAAGKISRKTWILLFCVCFGGLMELLQATVALNRSGNWIDIIANLIGAAGGLLFFRLLTDMHEKKQISSE
jgi:VanZ family protein